ncbi:hypothetical protein BF49_5623 [Bradyrhizobium sp.]|uniref:hypothetical protein n=1 Tax=Bradyrhizobium sp. TaxID=376 RepID=UPI0007C1B364|nr:hypothetical protein [Bradyrhizobium sp.]CUT14543.1 hypothetical protein BF49_5623 [Bradyrhizobium sp.]
MTNDTDEVTMQALSYADFQQINIVRRVMGALGADFAGALAAAKSFAALRAVVLEINSAQRGSFASAARRHAGVCSSGERLVLLGLLTLCDFAKIADDIVDDRRRREGGALNQLFGGGDDDTRAALGACIQNAYY